MNNSLAGKAQSGIIRASLIYAFGDLLTKGARIVLVPYYVLSLTQPELGQLAILTAISLFTWTVGSFGLPMAVQRQFFDYGTSGSRFVSSVWCWRLLAGTPVLAVVWLSIGWLTRLEVAWIVPPSLLACAVTSGFLRGGVSIVESWFIVQQKPVQYRSFTFTQFLFTTLLTIGLVSGLGLGIAGVIVAELIGWCLWTLLSGYLLFQVSTPDWKGIRWSELAAYCGPALPHSLFMWGLSGLDRFQLPALGVPLDRIGVYDVAYQLASYLSIVTLAVRSAWLPKYFSEVAQQAESGHQGYGRTATLFFGLVLSASALGVLVAPEILSVLVKSASPEHVQIFRVIVAGGIGMAGFIAFNQPLLSDRRIGWVAVASGTGLSINFLLNTWLIPSLGIFGAAISTVAAYGAMAGLMLVLVLRWYPVQWETMRLLGLLSGAGLVHSIAWYFGESAFTWNLAVRLAICGLFFQLVVFLTPALRQRFGRAGRSLSTISSDALQL